MRGLDPRIHPLAINDGLPGLAAFGGGPAMTIKVRAKIGNESRG
jgi:hypothetical protein